MQFEQPVQRFEQKYRIAQQYHRTMDTLASENSCFSLLLAAWNVFVPKAGPALRGIPLLLERKNGMGPKEENWFLMFTNTT